MRERGGEIEGRERGEEREWEEKEGESKGEPERTGEIEREGRDTGIKCKRVRGTRLGVNHSVIHCYKKNQS